MSAHVPQQRPRRPIRPDGPFKFFEPADLTERIVLFGDIGAEMAQIALQLRHVDAFIDQGIDPPTRMLFVGPSGTGKTLAARTIGASLGLPVCVADLGSFVGKYLGETASNIATAFRVSAAEGAILFLDEIDGMSQSRTHGKDSGASLEMCRATTAFFQQLDWAPKRQLVIAATNFPDLLDPALVRRFTKQVTFGLPNTKARRALVEGWLKRVDGVDAAEVEALVRESESLSCADLRSAAMDIGRKTLMRNLKARGES